MAIFQGTSETKYINIRSLDPDAPIDISGWTFRAQLRPSAGSPTLLGELTTANGGFVTMDAANGRIALILDDSLTVTLPVGRVHFDVLHENAGGGPVWIFGGSFMVKQPVTR